jgi:hypothetical protein
MEDRRIAGVVAGLVVVLAITFFFGYNCGSGTVEKKYEKQTETIQKIKQMVNGL